MNNITTLILNNLKCYSNPYAKNFTLYNQVNIIKESFSINAQEDIINNNKLLEYIIEIIKLKNNFQFTVCIFIILEYIYNNNDMQYVKLSTLDKLNNILKDINLIKNTVLNIKQTNTDNNSLVKSMSNEIFISGVFSVKENEILSLVISESILSITYLIFNSLLLNNLKDSFVIDNLINYYYCNNEDIKDTISYRGYLIKVNFKSIYYTLNLHKEKQHYNCIFINDESLNSIISEEENIIFVLNLIKKRNINIIISIKDITNKEFIKLCENNNIYVLDRVGKLDFLNIFNFSINYSFINIQNDLNAINIYNIDIIKVFKNLSYSCIILDFKNIELSIYKSINILIDECFITDINNSRINSLYTLTKKYLHASISEYDLNKVFNIENKEISISIINLKKILYDKNNKLVLYSKIWKSLIEFYFYKFKNFTDIVDNNIELDYVEVNLNFINDAVNVFKNLI